MSIACAVYRRSYYEVSLAWANGLVWQMGGLELVWSKES